MGFWFVGAILLWFCLYFSQCSGELIKALPGQPSNISFHQHSGYIVTNAGHGRSLFYYFVEADSIDYLTRPLTLWLNGGPGCSTLGFGAFMENGPFQVGPEGVLFKNSYSWNLAEDNLAFILNWFDVFPLYKNSDFFLVGESYAGHYIPQLAALILDYNKKPNVKPINLKAIALGNPLLDIDISVLNGEFLWSHGTISDERLMLENTVCNNSMFLREYIHSGWSQGCNDVQNRVSDEMSEDVESDDLLLPKCLSISSSSAQQFRPMGLSAKADRRSGAAGDPCLMSRIGTYLNRHEVQKALYANTTNLPYHWDFCIGPLVYQEENLEINIIPLISDLLKAGLPIWLYSGDQDSKIPLTQTRMIANSIANELELSTFTNYGPWYSKKQVGGWSQTYGALKEGRNVTLLTYATVRGAAHEVPFSSPSQALTLFHSFLNGTTLPRPKH